MQKEFQYILINSAGQSFNVDEEDLVFVQDQPVFQEHAPDGWQDQMVQFSKNSKYFTLFRGFTIPLRYVKDSARILRDQQYKFGFETICQQIILKLDPVTMKHRSWYKGEIDMSQMADRKTYVELNLLEGGARKLLNANEGKTYEIPLGEDAETLVLDGISLENTVNYIIQSGNAGVGATYLGALFVNQEGAYRDIVFNSANNFIGVTFDPDSTEYIIRNDGPARIFNIKAKYAVRKAAFFLSYRAHYYTSNGTTTTFPVQIYSGTTPAGVFLNVEWETAITLQPGESAYIYSQDMIPGDPIEYGENGTLEVKFEYRLAETTHRAWRADQLAAKLVAKVIEGGTGTYPALTMTGAGTEADPARALLLLSGDSIRNFDNAVIKTTFQDFFKAMNVVKFVGLDIVDEEIVIDKREKFYSGPVAFDFGEVKDCEVTVAEDLIYNSVKVGYPDQDFEDVNGRTEFNTTQEYSLPITRVVKELDLVCPYRADSYGIEYTRINMEGKTTTDSSSDNDVFIVDAIGIKDNTGKMIWRPYRKAYTSMSGVLTNTVFNVELSPKRLLLKHLPEIAHMFYGLSMIGKQITFQKSEKNADLTTVEEIGAVTETIQESAPVDAVLTPAMHLPYYFDIVTKVPANFLQIMDAAKRGRFQLKWLGENYTGFLEDGGIKPETMEEQKIKLRVAPENNLLKLIR